MQVAYHEGDPTAEGVRDAAFGPIGESLRKCKEVLVFIGR